jgi:hypothetical protein
MPATAKPPIVPNNFDFKVLYDILIPPYSHRVSETTSCARRGFVRTVATPLSFEPRGVQKLGSRLAAALGRSGFWRFLWR